MGAMLPGGKGRRTRGGRSYRAMAEINVTPFVDVMLVLLVIFMVTAPLLTVGVEVDLPKSKMQAIKGNDEPLAVSIDAAGKVYVQDTEMPVESLAARLLAISKNNMEVRIFVRGDRSIDYGRVMEVMSSITEAGFRKVALVARDPEVKSTSKKGK